MFEKLPESAGAVLGYTVSGRLTADDVEQMQAEALAAIEEHGSIRLLARMDDMDGVEPSALWQDLTMTPEYTRSVDRMAVVGAERWHEWTTRLSKVIAEARYFEPDQLDQAWAWLREGGFARTV